MGQTAEQIARKLGISNATVSRVLNNSQSVSPQTREAVLAMVRESGEMPRLLGPRAKRAPARQSVKSGGLVQVLNYMPFEIPKIADADAAPPTGELVKLPRSEFFAPEARLATSFTRHIMDGIIDEIRNFGIRAVVQVTENLRSRTLLNEVNARENCGLFLLGIYTDEVMGFLEKCRCPIVSFMTWDINGWPDYVGIDNYRGIRLAFNHVRERGHTRIGYVAGDLELLPVFRERANAYKSLLAEAGLPYRADWVTHGSCNIDPIQAGMEKMLQSSDRPTAILCCFDGAAVAVKRAADRLGLKIPGDLSVVGFDDEDVAQLFSPPLTTIHVPTSLMGRQAVHLMMMRQQRPVRPGEAVSLRVTPTLVVRQSTAAPPKTIVKGAVGTRR